MLLSALRSQIFLFGGAVTWRILQNKFISVAVVVIVVGGVVVVAVVVVVVVVGLCLCGAMPG